MPKPITSRVGLGGGSSITQHTGKERGKEKRGGGPKKNAHMGLPLEVGVGQRGGRCSSRTGVLLVGGCPRKEGKNREKQGNQRGWATQGAMKKKKFSKRKCHLPVNKREDGRLGKAKGKEGERNRETSARGEGTMGGREGKATSHCWQHYRCGKRRGGV